MPFGKSNKCHCNQTALYCVSVTGVTVTGVTVSEEVCIPHRLTRHFLQSHPFCPHIIRSALYLSERRRGHVPRGVPERDGGGLPLCSSRVDDDEAARPAGTVARWQNLIPSFPGIAPGWRAWGRNPNKGRDQILKRSVYSGAIVQTPTSKSAVAIWQP